MTSLINLTEERDKGMEKRKHWSFRMTANNTWSWRAVDYNHEETLSGTEFDSLAECIVHAKQHGYVVFTPAEERRKRETRPALE